jgi:hypothetical protein
VNGGPPWVVSCDPKAFRLESLEVTVIVGRHIAANWGGVCKYRTEH